MISAGREHLFDTPAFANYLLDGVYDEMFTPEGTTRPHYEALVDYLNQLPADEVKRRKHSADLSFLHQGITFTVYGRKEGTERIFPNDLVPRIILNEEWRRIERGLEQLSDGRYGPGRHVEVSADTLAGGNGASPRRQRSG